MTFPFKLVSADSHIAEPPDLWTTRIDRKFRDRAPHLVSTDRGDAYVIDGESHRASWVGLLATKREVCRSRMLASVWKGAGPTCPKGRMTLPPGRQELDREGMEAELLYTTFGLGLFGLKDHEFRHACIAPSTIGWPSIAPAPRSDCSAWR